MKENDRLLEKDSNVLENEKANNQNEEDLDKKKMDQALDRLIKTPKSSNFSMICYIIGIFILFFILLFLFFYLHFGSYKADILVHNFRVLKPRVDERKYRAIKLSNNLEAFLISDQNTATCAASISVGVGSFYDDNNVPGLAHFFEHMLFLGSKSYPSADIFNNHLRDYFGSTNAFTEEEKTTYYFDIGKKGYDKALYMFSRMFAEPLLDLNLMNKEIDAVNSEHEKNINQDNWRQQQIIRLLANPNHPFNSFSTGNNVTLRNIEPIFLHQKIVNFYNSYYVPSNMRLTVISDQDLDIIQEQVTKYFGNIRTENKEVNVKTYGTFPRNENAFYKDNLGKIVYFKKLGSSSSLDFVFSIDEVNSKYKTKPENYLTYLIKYSGEGSLIRYLKENNYAISLDAGIINSFSDFSQYAITITLTNNGLAHIQKVIDLTFGYINQIKETKINKDTYLEIKNIYDNKFKFLEKSTSYGTYLSNIAGNMFDYNYKEILYGDYMHKVYNETLISNFLDSIKPENVLIFIGSKTPPNLNFTLNYFNQTSFKKEKWYGTEYMERKLNETERELLSRRHNVSILGIRPQNLFITKEKSISRCLEIDPDCFNENDIIIPNLFYNDSKLKLWVKTDKSFKVPKVQFSLNMMMKNAITNTLDHLKIRIFNNYINYLLATKLSDAVEAGNFIRLSLDDNGISISVQAYSDLIQNILKVIIDNFYTTKFDEKIFNQTVEFTEKSLRQIKNLPPFKKFPFYFQRLIKPNSTIYTEELELIRNIKFNDFVNNIVSFREDIIINSLLYGNVKNNSINFIKDLIVNYTSNSKTSLKFQQQDQFDRVYNISNMLVYRIKNDLRKEVNHLIANYYQIGLKDIKSSLITSILELTWGNSFFHELRTKSQLGYVVSGGKRIINNVMYYRVIVQGSKMDPELIDIEIEKVILNLRKTLEKFNNYALDEYKFTLKNQISKPDVNLNERFSTIWSEIAENTLEFDRKFKLINELNSITIQDVLNAFDNIFFLNPRKLSIQIYSGKSTLENKKTTGEYYLNKTIKYKVMNDLKYFTTHNYSIVSLYKPSRVNDTSLNIKKASSMIRKLK